MCTFKVAQPTLCYKLQDNTSKRREKLKTIQLKNGKYCLLVMFVARNRVHVAFGTFVNQNVEYRGAFVPRETRYAVWKKQAYRIRPFCKQNERALVGTSTKNWNLWFSNVKYVSMYLIIVKKCEILSNLYTIKYKIIETIIYSL